MSEENEMPTITCKKCGSKTNTAVSDRVDEKGCFARIGKVMGVEKWVKGCGYDKANLYEKLSANRVMCDVFYEPKETP